MVVNQGNEFAKKSTKVLLQIRKRKSLGSNQGYVKRK
jgi:hypothetical protein